MMIIKCKWCGSYFDGNLTEKNGELGFVCPSCKMFVSLSQIEGQIRAEETNEENNED